MVFNVYMGLLLMLLLLTLLNIVSMPKLAKSPRTHHNHQEKVSVLIPLRNEERNVIRLIRSLKQLTYAQVEFILLDDQSTDQTYPLLMTEVAGDSRFTIVKGEPLPDGWTGKVYACHQLSRLAQGDYLLYLDADVEVKKDVIEQSMSTVKGYRAQMLTGFPKFPVSTLLGKLLVPMQHFLVYAMLPVWVANHTTRSAFTAAHGAFLFIHRESYLNSGGHQAISGSLVDDVHLARQLKKHQFRVLLVDATSQITCYMYETNREVWNGFKKNIFAGVGRKVSAVWLITLLFSLFYLVPFVLSVNGILMGDIKWMMVWGVIVLQAFIVDVASKEWSWRFLFHPLAILILLILLHISMRAGLKPEGYSWKGRVYH